MTLKQIMAEDSDCGDVWVDAKRKLVYLNIGDAFGEIIDEAHDAAKREYPGHRIEILNEGGQPRNTRAVSHPQRSSAIASATAGANAFVPSISFPSPAATLQAIALGQAPQPQLDPSWSSLQAGPQGLSPAADQGSMHFAWGYQPEPAQSPEQLASGRMCYFHPERPAISAQGFAAMCPECLDNYEQAAARVQQRGLTSSQRQAMPYHVAPTQRRRLIQEQGLRADAPRINQESEHPQGVYTWDDPEVAWKYRGQGPNMYRDMDVWHVDTDQLPMQRDPWFDTNHQDRAEDFPGAQYYPGDIEPERVTPHSLNPWFSDEPTTTSCSGCEGSGKSQLTGGPCYQCGGSGTQTFPASPHPAWDQHTASRPDDPVGDWETEGGRVSADWYHMAPTTERARIQQHGLQPANPGISDRWQDASEAWRANRPTGVYVTDRPSPQWWGSPEHPEAYDMWRIPGEQVSEYTPDGLPYPEGEDVNDVTNAVVVPHVVHPELEQGGPEIHGQWPKRGRVALAYDEQADMRDAARTRCLYHVAPTTERERIRQHGLQPADPALNWQSFHDDDQHPSGVYMFNDLERAKNYVTMLEFRRGVPHDIWAAQPHTSEDDPDEWTPDPDLGSSSQYTTEPVTPQLIEGPEHREDMPEYMQPQYVQPTDPWQRGQYPLAPDEGRGKPYPQNDPNTWQERVGAMTPAQKQRQLGQLEATFGPSQTNVTHQFLDQWSIHQLPTYGEIRREGQMMQHCWAEFDEDEPQPNDARLGQSPFYSLRDPQGWPHASFQYVPEQPWLGEVYGHGDSPLHPQHAQRLQQWFTQVHPDGRLELLPEQFYDDANADEWPERIQQLKDMQSSRVSNLTQDPWHLSYSRGNNDETQRLNMVARQATTVNEWQYPSGETPHSSLMPRKPLIYDRGSDELHVGQWGMQHNQLAQAMLADPDVVQRSTNDVAGGWLGHDPQVRGYDEEDTRTPYGGWYGQQAIPATVHQVVEEAYPSSGYYTGGHVAGFNSYNYWQRPPPATYQRFLDEFRAMTPEQLRQVQMTLPDKGCGWPTSNYYRALQQVLSEQGQP